MKNTLHGRPRLSDQLSPAAYPCHSRIILLLLSERCRRFHLYARKPSCCGSRTRSRLWPGSFQRLPVHVSHHQHRAAGRVLDNGRNQPRFIVFQAIQIISHLVFLHLQLGSMGEVLLLPPLLPKLTISTWQARTVPACYSRNDSLACQLTIFTWQDKNRPYLPPTCLLTQSAVPVCPLRLYPDRYSL